MSKKIKLGLLNFCVCFPLHRCLEVIIVFVFLNLFLVCCVLAAQLHPSVYSKILKKKTESSNAFLPPPTNMVMF